MVKTKYERQKRKTEKKIKLLMDGQLTKTARGFSFDYLPIAAIWKGVSSKGDLLMF